jgi:hypothetical protein
MALLTIHDSCQKTDLVSGTSKKQSQLIINDKNVQEKPRLSQAWNQKIKTDKRSKHHLSRQLGLIHDNFPIQLGAQ